MRFYGPVVLLGSLVVIGGAAAPAIGAEAYLIAPGDVLAVAVAGTPDFPLPVPVTVRPDGTFSFPYVEQEVQAGGKTVAQVTQELQAALDRRYQHASVAVNLTTVHSQVVFVVGEVLKPGPVLVQSASITIAQAIFAAGGLTERASETQAHAYLSGKPATIDLQQALSGELQVQLAPGDTLIIDPRDLVTILGEVTKPGVYVAPSDARITALLALPGNLLPNADPRRALLVRKDGQTVVVDLTKLLLDPGSPENTSAASIDMLVVPPEQDLVVTGAVVKPGVYRVGAQARLLEAIALASGRATDADHRNVIVVNRDNQTVTADLDQASAHPESDANVRIGEASMVVVGRSRNEVSVTGEVTKPCVIPTLVPIELSNCIAQAGGLTKNADPRKVLIIKGDGTEETIDASKLVGKEGEGGAAAGKVNDPLLTSGDSVIVGRRYARVVVLGGVKEPGSYDFNEGDRVVDAIALAGGFDKSKKARMSETSIVRSEGGKVMVLSLDMAKALRGAETLISEPLQDRDIVYVPQGKTPPWRDIVTAIVGVSSFLRLFVP